ncbi:hypothetical protein FHU33_3071 [Blastococcus colisei]|uniref:Uncharacterized protein n=1 Tax=Blastococcus colisei TaxID=1564162 RepID=A0A543PHU0_9ACTN|nr:hypothetical protein [Blastococcus colisei]TQN43617.1 hypothetical protein FHU33_3071 [Blastococcus colisei]
MARLRFTDDVSTSVGFQAIVALGALANASVLVLYAVEGESSVWGIVLRILGVLVPLLLLIASVNGRRFRREQEADRS